MKKNLLIFVLGIAIGMLLISGLGIKGVYTKEIPIDENIIWFVDDSDNTIRAVCGMDNGESVTVASVVIAMPGFGTFSNKPQVIQSFFKEAAKLSLGITDEDIED